MADPGLQPFHLPVSDLKSVQWRTFTADQCFKEYYNSFKIKVAENGTKSTYVFLYRLICHCLLLVLGRMDLHIPFGSKHWLHYRTLDQQRLNFQDNKPFLCESLLADLRFDLRSLRRSVKRNFPFFLGHCFHSKIWLERTKRRITPKKDPLGSGSFLFIKTLFCQLILL